MKITNLLKKFFFQQKIANQGTCSICDDIFPDEELYPSEDLFLCQAHLEAFKTKDWTLISSCLSDPNNPHEALKAQEDKERLKAEGILSYIRTSYIEVDGIIKTKFDLYREK